MRNGEGNGFEFLGLRKIEVLLGFLELLRFWPPHHPHHEGEPNVEVAELLNWGRVVRGAHWEQEGCLRESANVPRLGRVCFWISWPWREEKGGDGWGFGLTVGAAFAAAHGYSRLPLRGGFKAGVRMVNWRP